MTYKNGKILLISLVLSVFLIISHAPLFTASAQETGEPRRIAESSEVSVKPSFQTDDFVFLVKKENGEFEAASANNIMTIKLIQQRSTLYLKRMHLVNDQKVEIAKTFC